MSQYCSRTFSDMFKKRLSLCVQNGYFGDDGRLHVKKTWPVLITSLTHMFCQRNRTKWDQFGSDAACLSESSFSKTLISGPQISCQSSAVDRHRIGGKGSPQQINNMSIKRGNVCSQTSTQARRYTLPGRHVREHTHTQRDWWVCLTCDSTSSFRLIGTNSVFSINSRWLLQSIRERIWSWGLSSALLINIHLQFILPRWIAISFYKGFLISTKTPSKTQGNISKHPIDTVSW